MTIYFSLAQLSNILRVNPLTVGDRSVLEQNVIGINTDSRQVEPGELFIALVGENFDGHDFIDRAIAQGAIAVVVSQPQAELTTPQFVVNDTLEAYQQIAQWWRKQFSIPVIGITGSVGKTSTKELVAAVLNTQGKVLKTQANFNNEIGVPKPYCKLPPNTTMQ